MLSLSPRLSREELRSLLRETATKIGSGYDAGGHSTEFGFGRVDAERAAATAQNL